MARLSHVRVTYGCVHCGTTKKGDNMNVLFCSQCMEPVCTRCWERGHIAPHTEPPFVARIFS